MWKKSLASILLVSACVSVSAADGVVRYQSDFSVAETAERFANLAQSKGLNVFARIDHQKNAQGVGLELRPTQVILFGNPKVGTPLMQCAQSVAIDLPQKVLVLEDADQKVWLSFNDPVYLQERHHIEGCEPVIKKVSQVLNGLAKSSVQ
ncbi:DUF302 domain-containing protein [Marinomonas epiphytica]